MSIKKLFDNRCIEFEDVSPAELPSGVAAYLVRVSNLYTHNQPLDIDEFGNLQAVRHNNGVTSFIASQEKTYFSDDQVELIHHVVDANTEGDVIGYGELRFALTDESEYFKDKPFISGLYTKPKYRLNRRGNLLGRLMVMEAISREKLGLPLYSDTLIEPDALAFIERLVKYGLVEQFIEGDDIRFKTVQEVS